MNMHVPQSLETALELDLLANVKTQIINPRNSSPVIDLVQDPKLAIYLLTINNENLAKYKPYKEFDNKIYIPRKEFINLIMFEKQFKDIKQIPPSKNGYYTGEDLISIILPNINLKTSEFEIINGFLSGTIKRSDNKIIHTIFKKYGADVTCDFINSLQNILNKFLKINGFSVGISDLIIKNSILKDIKNVIKEKIHNIEKINNNIQNGIIEKKFCINLNDEFELLINKELNSAIDIAGNKLLNYLNPINNRFIAMVQAGSKGKNINLSQMITCVGQQNIDGKRIPMHFGNRTLPHFCQFDNSPLARGFIENSFYNGLNPFEYYFHSMAGREGLIDTAVRTSETGYISRKLIKALEDIKVNNDYTVRNHNNDIISLNYGNDNIDHCKVEKINLNEMFVPLIDFEMYYKDFISDKLKYLLEPEIFDNVINNNEYDNLYKTYYDELLNERIFIINNFSINDFCDTIIVPVNIDHIILNNINLYNLGSTISDIEPYYIIKEIYKLIKELNNTYENYILNIVIKVKLSPYNIIVKNHLTKNIFDKIIEDIKNIYYKSFVDPGEMVGIIAAQSLGERTTQMTLNTFHSAGISSTSNVTRGLPRLKELLHISKNIKNPFMHVNLNKKNPDIKYIRNTINNILNVDINDIILTSSIYFDPDDYNTVIDNDIENLNKYFENMKYFNIENNKYNKCPFILRLTFDNYKMIEKNITILDIYETIFNKYENELEYIYFDNIIRIRFSEEFNEENDYFNLLKNLDSKINTFNIKGIKGINNINIISNKKLSIVESGINKGEIEKYNEIILETDGSNILDIIKYNVNDNININKILSNDIYELLDIYGAEVAYKTLLKEINTTFISSGNEVEYRHINLLVNIMTYKGKLMSIDRFGIKQSDYGILAQCSFEETPEIVSRASVFSEVDNLNGVSGNIIFGQKIKGGTGYSNILFDEAKYFSNKLVNNIVNNTVNLYDKDTIYDIIELKEIPNINIEL